MEKEVEQQPEQDQQQPEPQESNAKYHLTSLFTILINFGIGYLFCTYSQYRNRECVYLSEFSYWFGLIILITAVITLLVVWPCKCCPCCDNEFTQNVFNVTMSIQSTTYFIFLIGLTIVIFFNEPCGSLRKLVIIYLIVIYLFLLIFGGLATALGLKKKATE